MKVIIQEVLTKLIYSYKFLGTIINITIFLYKSKQNETIKMKTFGITFKIKDIESCIKIPS